MVQILLALPKQDSKIFNKESTVDEIFYSLLARINIDLISYKEVLESSESQKWQEAINNELNAIKVTSVMEIVDKPVIIKDGRKFNIVDSRWVFKSRTREDREIKFMGRLVIKAFRDNTNYDLRETHAPVSLLRIILAITNKYDSDILQLGVKTAFLNDILRDEIYMDILNGIELSTT